MRNPNWLRDEVVLALDLYFRAGRKQLPPTHPDVMHLSEVLNRLPFHRLESRDSTFRNPAGISMILGNFLGIDPEKNGRGLSRNNHLQEEVWRDFGDDAVALRRTAEAIERTIASNVRLTIAFDESGDEETFPEGLILTRLHLLRERNREAVELKKQRVLSETGKLACEVCGFDFALVYGPLGVGFAECHHKLPLANLAEDRTTRLADLAIVCANCHRILHRARPVLTVEQLRQVVMEEMPARCET